MNKSNKIYSYSDYNWVVYLIFWFVLLTTTFFMYDAFEKAMHIYLQDITY